MGAEDQSLDIRQGLAAVDADALGGRMGHRAHSRVPERGCIQRPQALCWIWRRVDASRLVPSGRLPGRYPKRIGRHRGRRRTLELAGRIESAAVNVGRRDLERSRSLNDGTVVGHILANLQLDRRVVPVDPQNGISSPQLLSDLPLNVIVQHVNKPTFAHEEAKQRVFVLGELEDAQLTAHRAVWDQVLIEIRDGE
jgi:hypothetical protein